MVKTKFFIYIFVNVIKFIDSTQILNENEFILLITKRKQDLIWKEIQYFQLFIKSRV